MHKPPEGGGECKGRIAKGMLKSGMVKEGEESDWGMEPERLEGKREVETFVHGIRNGEIVGGQRMKDA
eukprot:1936611-Pleurochrysis_carterae.AAC.1